MSNVHKVNIIGTNHSKVDMFYIRAMNELIDFYNIQWIDNTPIVLLVDSRKDFNTLALNETEDWVVGQVLNYNTILLLSPDSYEKESCHKYSDEEYYFVLKHELGHLFFNILSKGNAPVWLDEGLAIYVSGELRKKTKPKVLRHFLRYYTEYGKEVYSEAGFAVEGLVKKYGKDKVINFLKNLPNIDIDNERQFNRSFEDYFNMNLSYKDFQSLL